ncbi:MAG TPA: hypothetical protein VGQ83_11860 [Polyangia bacterium]
MRWGLGGLVALALGASLMACGPSTVRVPVNDSGAEFRQVAALDCRVYDQKKRSITAGFSVSALFGAVSAGPTVELASTTGVHWDESVQRIVARYKELCSRFNAGAVSLEAYERRLQEIDALASEAEKIRDDGLAAIRGRAGAAFAEVDGQGGRGQDAERIAGAIEALHRRTAP